MGGLTGTLKTDHHNDRRRLGGNLKLRRFRAHQGDQLLVYDLDDLLCGEKAFKHRLADGTLGHGLDEFTHDLEVDVCLKQGHLDLAHALADVRLGKLALIAELFQRRR